MFKMFNHWRRQREVIRELSRLSNRELADIGFAREDVKAVARRAAGVSSRHDLEALAPAWGLHNQRALG